MRRRTLSSWPWMKASYFADVAAFWSRTVAIGVSFVTRRPSPKRNVDYDHYSWRRETYSTAFARRLISLQRVEHQSAQQLRVKVRRFGRHLLQGAGDLLDVSHR